MQRGHLNVMTALLETGRVKLGYAEGSPERDDCPVGNREGEARICRGVT